MKMPRKQLNRGLRLKGDRAQAAWQHADSARKWRHTKESVKNENRRGFKTKPHLKLKKMEKMEGFMALLLLLLITNFDSELM